MYVLKNSTGRTLTMQNGEPFYYSTERLAQIGAKVLRPKTPRHLRPLRIVPV